MSNGFMYVIDANRTSYTKINETIQGKHVQTHNKSMTYGYKTSVN